MAQRNIVVIGASAGGLPALVDMLQPLPIDVEAAFFIVVHTAPDSSGLLPAILERFGAWRAAYAKDQEPIQYGRIYLASPDHHLLIKRGFVRVSHGPRENRFRPAVDPLFRTAARAYGPRVIGIVLSGGLDDGTHGLELIKRHGGIALSQDPQEALVPSMPLSAIQNVVDYILTSAAIGAELPLLVRQEVTDDASVVPEDEDVAEGIPDHLGTGHIPGPPSPSTCPDCGGSMWELEDGFTAESLHAEQGEGLERTFWALRALEEQASLRRRMSLHAEHIGRLASARELEAQAKDPEPRAGSLRRILMRQESHATTVARE